MRSWRSLTAWPPWTHRSQAKHPTEKETPPEVGGRSLRLRLLFWIIIWLMPAAFVSVVQGIDRVQRDFSDVRDVVRAYWLAAERGEPGVFNVCSGRATAVSDILTGLAAHTPLEVERRTDTSRLRDNEVMEIKGSHANLTEATGWRPEIGLSDTLRDTLDWWRERAGAGVAR